MDSNSGHAESHHPGAKNMKHFKKSMIVEYERIESTTSSVGEGVGGNMGSASLYGGGLFSMADDSQSSMSSMASSSAANKSNQQSFVSPLAFTKSEDKIKKKSNESKKRRREGDQSDQDMTSDLYEDERNDDDKSKKSISAKKAKSSSDETVAKKKKKKHKENREKSKKKKKSTADDHEDTEAKSKKKKKKKKSEGAGVDEKKLYCICRSSDSKRFMIACDKCDEWYHGVCVGVNQSLSFKVKKFYCHLCRNHNPSLKIKYKSKFQEASETFSKPNAAKYTGSNKSLSRFYDETQARIKKEEELLHKVKSKSTASRPVIKTESTENNEATSLLGLTSNTSYGKSNVSGEDIENFVQAIARMNTIKTESTFNNDHDYVTHDPVPIANQQPSERRTTKSSSESNDSSDSDASTESIDSLSELDSENSESSSSEDSSSSSESTVTSSSSSNRGDKKPVKPSSSKTSKLGLNKKMVKKLNEKSGTKKAEPVTAAAKLRVAQRRRSSSTVTLSEQEAAASRKPVNKLPKKEAPIQCWGPECVNAARENSKYCSDECGIKLAHKRLATYLPVKYESFVNSFGSTSCDADTRNTRELERVGKEIESLRNRLVELEQKYKHLDELIERARFAKINPNVEREREKSIESSEAVEVYCVSCGLMFPEKHALKHMDKCFNKIESQAFFGSYFRTQIEGQSIICEDYNPQTRMYCKRLKVMCPEHDKEKKINDDEVCGYPLPSPTNIMEDSPDQICLAPKRSCSLHFKWEKLRRAQIDLEKLRTWFKLEELYEQKRSNETALNKRNGLLSVLLYETKLQRARQSTNQQCN